MTYRPADSPEALKRLAMSAFDVEAVEEDPEPGVADFIDGTHRKIERV